MRKKPLPVGHEFFQDVIERGLYYVDKTLLIKDIIDSEGAVNLLTRPRRFGKTLNLSMLKNFFEAPVEGAFRLEDKRHLFNNLKIEAAGEKYMAHQGKYPVINLSLKSAKQPTYEMAYALLKKEVLSEFGRHTYLKDSKKLDEKEKEAFDDIYMERVPESEYAVALKTLSECLELHHGQKCIILIDEYDVPLENAYFRGFYDQMIDFIRSLFESALKTNQALAFAVITGCLRISKESIFTGLNNLRVNSILTNHFAEYFGFTEPEVFEALAYYEIEDQKKQAQSWYNGYVFGDTNVYNPWSIVNYLEDKKSSKKSPPRAHWSNTSSNSIVRNLIDLSGPEEKLEIETLIAGGTITKPVHEDVTYGDITSSMDNLWNFLFFTGYLKKISQTDVTEEDEKTYVTMAIPNREVRYAYNNQIKKWFDEQIAIKDRSIILKSMLNKDIQTAQNEINAFLGTSISYMDYEENFYHGALTALLSTSGEYLVRSNREMGDGRSDIYIKCVINRDLAAIIEVKVAKEFKELDKKCDEALAQIEEKRYELELEDEGYENILKYGIAFHKKYCKIKISCE